MTVPAARSNRGRRTEARLRPTSATGLVADRVFKLFLLAWLAILTPYLGAFAGRPPGSAYRDSGTFVLIAAAAAIAAIADLHRQRDPAERRTRQIVAAAFAVWTVEELLEFRYGSDLFLVLHDGLFVLFYLLLGLAAYAGAGPDEIRQTGELRRLARLETTIFAAGMFIYFVIIPLRLAEAEPLHESTSAVLFLTLDVLLCGLFGWRLRRARSGRDERRWRWMCLGAFLFLVSDGLFFLASRGRLDLARNVWLDLVWFLPQIAIVAAVRTPSTGSRSSGVLSPLDRESPVLRFAPAFLYAGLVPAAHLLSELIAHDGSRPEERTQGIFALLLALLLGLLAAVHQVRISALQGAMRAELLESRRQLANAMKLEAIGRLAAGVAHDFNNLLTVVVGRTDLLLSKTRDAEHRANLEMVLRAARRAAELTSELLAVGQREIGFRSHVDVGSALRALAHELETICGSRIDLQLLVTQETLVIGIDPNHLERIVRNLASNACEAMPEGGVLRLELRAHEVPGAPAGEADGLPPGRYAEMIVSDDGVGMDVETQRQLFEPFFTTKTLGRGSGLGLASVYGLVRQNGGEITVESRLGVGSRFVVRLPLAGESFRSGMVLEKDAARSLES